MKMDLEKLAPGIERSVIRALHEPLMAHTSSLPTDPASLVVVKLPLDAAAFLKNRAEVYSRYLAATQGAVVEVTEGMVLQMLVMAFMRQSEFGGVLAHTEADV